MDAVEEPCRSQSSRRPAASLAVRALLAGPDGAAAQRLQPAAANEIMKAAAG